MLHTFSQDEEIQTIHLPVIFAAIVDLIDVCYDDSLIHNVTFSANNPPFSVVAG